MLYFFPYPFLAGCALLLLLLILSWRRHHNRTRLFFLALFWIYLLLAARETLFPFPLDNTQRQPLDWILAHINLRPFYFGGLYGPIPHIARLEIFGNLLLTIPFGLLLPLATRSKISRLPWLILLGGLSFETAQFTLCLVYGGNYRSVDINDVILNTTGTLIGYGFFCLFAGVFRFVSMRFKIPETGLKAYLLEMTRRM